MLVAAVPASRSCIICLWATEQRAVEGGRLDRKSSTPLARATRDKESPDSELVRSTPGERVPLAALRLALDDDSAKADWSMNPDGVPGRSLMMPARCRVTLPVRLGGEALFSSRAMLLPHDWRDGRGVVRASVEITDSDGRRQEIWSRYLRSSASRGAPGGYQIASRLPSSTRELHLAIHPGVQQRRGVARAIWLDPAIIDPGAKSWTEAIDATRPTEAARSQSPSRGPLISVLTPVHDPPLAMLEEAIESVRLQTIAHWELLPRRRWLVRPADHRRARAIQRHRSSHPPRTAGTSRRHLRRYQRRAQTRHRRIRRAA